MATSNQFPPASSQKSTSSLSDPPDSAEEVLDEITVNLNAPSDSRQPPSPHDDDTMVRSRGALSRNMTSQRERPKRQARTRKEPTVDADEPLDDTEIRVSSTASRRRTAAKRSQLEVPSQATAFNPPAAKKAKVANRSKKWEPTNITQNSRSPLVDADLRSLLLQPAAWDCLTVEDKAEIIALFPDQKHILDGGTPDARPNLESLKNDDNFRHDAEQYVTNLAKGMHDPVWLKDAWTAHHRRAAGDFDAFYIRKLEVDWNVTIPDEFKPAHLRNNQHGESSSAGQFPQGEGAGSEEIGNDAAVSEEKGGVVAKVAIESNGAAKTDTTMGKNSDGTSELPEGAETGGKGSTTTGSGVRLGVVDEETSLRGGEKPFGANGPKALAANGEAAVAEDPMDVDDPEAPTHSGGE